MAYQGMPSYPGTPAYQYSDWIQRVGAYLIDGVPPAILIIIGFLTGNGYALFLFWLIAVAFSVYNRWILGGQGQTLGKKVLGIMLLSEETAQPIGTLNAFVRDVCHFVDSIICYVGYLFPLWDPKRQTIADKIMKTVVIPANQ